MSMASRQQKSKIPRSGAAREALRKKGQFWTPNWVAEAMVSYSLGAGANALFDPAVGAGVFLLAARKYAQAHHRRIELLGCELDPDALNQCRSNGLTGAELEHVRVGDFILSPLLRRYPSIVANPPYIRHHRLPEQTKAQLKNFSRRLTGRVFDGRAGLQLYFLLRCLEALEENGRLAFIVSADICEGVYAPALWDWICSKFCLDAVITYAAEAAPFPEVDTNAILFLIGNRAPKDTFLWARCLKSNSPSLKQWIDSDLPDQSADGDLTIATRDLTEGLRSGFSRPPQTNPTGIARLGDFATVMRGIASGDNDFFFFTRKRAVELGIPEQYLILAIGRTRDVDGKRLTKDDLERLDAHGRPTLLLSVNGCGMETLPASVQEYLRHGEEMGVSRKTLISTRKPWYKMESRRVPPILFAYLGRRDARFIRNLAGVVPLTCLLCVYPKTDTPEFIEKLWSILSDPKTIANLSLVGKSYGSGAIKVEPRSLEQLPLPSEVLAASGLSSSTVRQMELFS
ncbi:MAG: N-6 DNA methylase [Candidatus Sumerlaeota bacterium]|nr:N-6 DNA methylase [Candidatus Sumerlaeota bacterium]